MLYHINKDKGDESLSILACSFSEIFKGKQISLEPCRNLECPIRCLFNYFQVRLVLSFWFFPVEATLEATSKAYSERCQTSKMRGFCLNS